MVILPLIVIGVVLTYILGACFLAVGYLFNPTLLWGGVHGKKFKNVVDSFHIKTFALGAFIPVIGFCLGIVLYIGLCYLVICYVFDKDK